MVSGDEPELDAFVHDAHAVFGLDALVAVPDHVLVEHRGELVDRHAPEAPLVEELLLETAEEPLRGRLKQEFFHGRDFAGVTIKGFIERLDGYMTWYRDERIKLTFGTSIAKRRRELGLMA